MRRLPDFQRTPNLPEEARLIRIGCSALPSRWNTLHQTMPAFARPCANARRHSRFHGPRQRVNAVGRLRCLQMEQPFSATWAQGLETQALEAQKLGVQALEGQAPARQQARLCRPRFAREIECGT